MHNPSSELVSRSLLREIIQRKSHSPSSRKYDFVPGTGISHFRIAHDDDDWRRAEPELRRWDG